MRGVVQRVEKKIAHVQDRDKDIGKQLKIITELKEIHEDIGKQLRILTELREIHEDIGKRLKIITVSLPHSQTGVDGHISGSSGHLAIGI